VLGAWESCEDSANGVCATSVVTCLSFWDYSLLTMARTTLVQPRSRSSTHHGVLKHCWKLQGPGSEAYKTTGRCFSVAAGRVAFTYALKGALPMSPWLMHVPNLHKCVRSVMGCTSRRASAGRGHSVLVLADSAAADSRPAARARMRPRPGRSGAADAGACDCGRAGGRGHARPRRALQGARCCGRRVPTS